MDASARGASLWVGLLLAGCRDASGPPARLVSTALASPSTAPSRLPRVAAAPRGEVLLSWVEEEGGVARLKFAPWRGEGWGSAREIARGQRWFVNWADFPSVAASEVGLAAHFLERSAEGTYDYRVRFSRSPDGERWSEPATLHTHEGPGEHGFVSLVPLGERFAAVWLDGRNAGGHGEPHAGAMALYFRGIGANGELGPEVLLDERVCDCCPTSAIAVGSAVLAAYRDRSDDEVRDISVVRVEGDTVSPVWSTNDGWRIAGCPVNGPVLCADGERVALVWFTLDENGASRTLCALSDDGGRTFAKRLQLAGADGLGRVDAVFDGAGHLVVTWLRADTERGEWRVARVGPDGRVLDTASVTEVSPGRESGLARLARADDGVLFAWTEAGPRVAVRRLEWK